MENKLNTHEIAQTAYALGEEFGTMVDSETRNKYAEGTGNGYTGLISLMAEAATALEQAFEDFRNAGRVYDSVFLYEAVPNMASNIAGFLALRSVNDLTARELRKLAEAAIADDLVPIAGQIDTEVTQNDVEVKFIDTKVKQSVITLPGVVFLRELEDYVCDAVEKAIRVALRRPVTGESFEIDVEGIKARYDLVRFALVFDSGVLYGVSRTSFEAGGDVGVITSGYSSSMRAYGPPEGWLSNEAWAAAFRNDNGGYGSETVPEKLRKLAGEVDDLLRASGGPEPVSNQLGCSASHVTGLMAELSDAMESLSIN